MRITIGRTPDNDIVYNEPSVSSHHADITFNGEYVLITDHSTNGTWINGRKLHFASSNISRSDRIVFPGNILLDWQVIDRLSRKAVAWEYTQRMHESSPAIRKGVHNWQNDKEETPREATENRNAFIWRGHS